MVAVEKNEKGQDTALKYSRESIMQLIKLKILSFQIFDNTFIIAYGRMSGSGIGTVN